MRRADALAAQGAVVEVALRLAAMSRAAGTTEDIGTPPDRPALIDSDQVSMALKQALLNELLLVTGAGPEAATV